MGKAIAQFHGLIGEGTHHRGVKFLAKKILTQKEESEMIFSYNIIVTLNIRETKGKAENANGDEHYKS